MAVGDAETRPTRWQRAKKDWHGLQFGREWRGGLGGGLVAALVLLGLGFPGEALVDVIVVLASALTAAILLPLVELGWAWLQAPMRMLTEDVIALRGDVIGIRERVAQLQQPPVALPEKEAKPDVRLTLLNEVRRGRAIADDPLWKFSGREPHEAGEWTERLTQFLNEHAHDSVEGFLRITGDTATTAFNRRVKFVERVAESLPTDTAKRGVKPRKPRGTAQ